MASSCAGARAGAHNNKKRASERKKRRETKKENKMEAARKVYYNPFHVSTNKKPVPPWLFF